MHRRGGARRRAVRAAAVLAALQYGPSAATLGTWSAAQALPGGLCRWRGPAGAPRVALTFDDGPHPEGTPAVLDRLDRLGLRATFFPLASMAERQPGALAEIRRRGHGVGVHGYRHAHHLARGWSWVRRDLEAAEQAMAALGERPCWYRPTYGQLTGSTLVAARRLGWRTVLWSAWGREWATGDPRRVAARLVGRMGPGSIALLHDSDAFGPPAMWRVALEALGHVAEALDRLGLEAVTLDELVPAGAGGAGGGSG